MAVCGDFGFRVGYAPEFGGEFGFAVGYGGPAGEFGFRVGYDRQVSGEFGFRVGYRGEEQHALQRLLSEPALVSVSISGGRTITRTNLKSLKYGIKLELVEGGATEIPCTEFSITEPTNGAISWSATLGPDAFRQFIPVPESGPFAGGKHRGGDVNDSGVKRRYRVEIRTAGRVWRRDWLIRNDYAWDLDKGRMTAVISGTDLSEWLVLVKDKNFGDFKSVQGSIHTVQGIMATILTAMGVRYRFEFDDAPMAQFTAIGQPMSLLQQLINEFQLEWFFDDDVFTVREPKYRENGPGRWRVTDRYQVRQAKFRATGAGIQTEKVVEKLDRASNIIAEFDEEAFEILGYHTVPFDPPRTSVDVEEIEVFHGTISIYQYLDADGNPIKGTSGTYRDSRPTYGCRFLYLEDSDTPWPPGRKPRAHIVWYGADPLGLPSQFSEYYTKRHRDAAAVAEWGTRREPVQQTPNIAHASQAFELARRCVENSLRLANILNLYCILWPWAERGETISLLLTAAGWTTQKYWYVESVTKTVGASKAEMSLQLSRKADPDE
ncbi:MAG: hypothetical protein AMXMBFR33_01390 [Candidatus Xenobia bacterium]